MGDGIEFVSTGFYFSGFGNGEGGVQLGCGNHEGRRGSGRGEVAEGKWQRGSGGGSGRSFDRCFDRGSGNSCFVGLGGFRGFGTGGFVVQNKRREGPLVGSLVGLEETVRLVSRVGLGRREKEGFIEK
jgi:hypothetical protein